MFWDCCHTCELPLGMSDAVTHLSCVGGLSGDLHFSQSLLTLFLAKGLPEFPGFRSAGCPELVRCLPAAPSAAIQNEKFSFIIQTFLPVSSKHSWKSFSLRYSFSLFPTRTHSGSSVAGWFLLEFMSWKHWVLYHMGQMHFSPTNSKIAVSFLEQYPQKA